MTPTEMEERIKELERENERLKKENKGLKAQIKIWNDQYYDAVSLCNMTMKDQKNEIIDLNNEIIEHKETEKVMQNDIDNLNEKCKYLHDKTKSDEKRIIKATGMVLEVIKDTTSGTDIEAIGRDDEAGALEKAGWMIDHLRMTLLNVSATLTLPDEAPENASGARD